MSPLQALFLGIIQGITEFLPISSSGHLIIFERIFHLNVLNLKSFDVVLHLGTLLAIILYFWKDYLSMLTALLKIAPSKSPRSSDQNYLKLCVLLIIATIPAVIIGALFEKKLDLTFRNLPSVAIAMLSVSLIFFLVEHPKFKKHLPVNTIFQAIVIGIAQTFALIPGVSRSGATISAALALGIDRVAAARFSFLLGSIAIAGAGLLTALHLSSEPAFQPISIYVIGFFASFISGFLSVKFLMKFLKNHPLHLFAWYRLIVAAIILVSIY